MPKKYVLTSAGISAPPLPSPLYDPDTAELVALYAFGFYEPQTFIEAVQGKITELYAGEVYYELALEDVSHSHVQEIDTSDGAAVFSACSPLEFGSVAITIVDL